MKMNAQAYWSTTVIIGTALLIGGCTGITITIHRPTPVTLAAAAPTPALAIAAVTFSTPALAIAAVTFSTPETAITAYLDGIAHQDIDAILAASAVDEPAEQFDFQGHVERMQAMPLLTSPAPADHPFYAEMNRIRRQSEILSLVRNFAYSLLSHEVIDGTMIAAPEPDRVRTFVTDIDPSRLAGLELVKIGTPMPNLLSSTRYQENTAKMAAIYGADELTERVALLAFEESYYLLGFSLLRYGDDWKILNQTSNLAGTSALGTVQPSTPEEFAGLIAAD